MTDADRMVVWLREAMYAAELEAEAAAEGAGGPHWAVGEEASCQCCVNLRTIEGGLLCTPDSRYVDFMAANDPAAVLRRIAADRKTLDLHVPVTVEYEDDSPPTLACRTCGSHFEYPAVWPCTTLRLLTEGYGWTEETT